MKAKTPWTGEVITCPPEGPEDLGRKAGQGRGGASGRGRGHSQYEQGRGLGTDWVSPRTRCLLGWQVAPGVGGTG